MYGINNKSIGVARMYVTTSVTHKLEVRIDLLTFMQIVNNFALESYSKLCSFHKLFVNCNVCQISMRFEEANCAWNNELKFNYEDLEEIVAGGQGSFGVYC